MPEGRFRPEGKLGTPHSHAFDKAIDDALIKRGPPDVPDEPRQEADLHDVTLQVTLRWNPNPGWEVDEYIAHVGH